MIRTVIRLLLPACLCLSSTMAGAADPTAAATREQTLAVAERGFVRFKSGLATGHWQPLLEMLSDDFVFYFPQGKYRGRHEGRAEAEEFFNYVSATFVGGLTITERYRVTAGESTVVFEFADEGQLRGEPYKGRVALSWDIRGDKIVAYREYFGGSGLP